MEAPCRKVVKTHRDLHGPFWPLCQTIFVMQIMWDNYFNHPVVEKLVLVFKTNLSTCLKIHPAQKIQYEILSIIFTQSPLSRQRGDIIFLIAYRKQLVHFLNIWKPRYCVLPRCQAAAMRRPVDLRPLLLADRGIRPRCPCMCDAHCANA